MVREFRGSIPKKKHLTLMKNFQKEMTFEIVNTANMAFKTTNRIGLDHL